MSVYNLKFLNVKFTFDRALFWSYYLGFITSLSIAFTFIQEAILKSDIRFLEFIVLLPPLFVVFFFKSKNFLKIASISWLLLSSLIIILFLSLYWVEDSERGRGLLILAQIISSVFLSTLIPSKRSKVSFCKAFLLGSTIVSTILYSQYLEGNQGPTLGFGGGFNRNNISSYFNFCILLCIYCLKGNHIKNNPLLVFLIIFYFIGVILTASRGGVLCLFAITICFIFYELLSNKNIYLVIFPIIGFLIVFLGSEKVEVLSRFTKQGQHVSTLGSRTEIWSYAVEKMFESKKTLFIGVGIGGTEKFLAEGASFSGKFGSSNIERKASHNSFIEYFTYLGIIGLPIALWLISILISRALLINSDRAFHKCMLIFLIMDGMVSIIWRYSFWPAIFIMIAPWFNKQFEETDTEPSVH